MAGSFWSGAGSSIISGALGLLGAGLNQGFSAINSSRQARNTKKVLSYQDELNRKYTRDSYGIMREGLQKAGYNPLLALGSSANSVSYGGSAGLSDSDQGSEAIASAIDAMRFRNENRLNKSQIKLNKSQEDLNTQATYKTFADELVARAQAGVNSATEAKILNDIKWDNVIKDAEFRNIIANTKYTNERSRGFSASSSQSHHYGAGAFSVKGDYSSSKSDSRSW